MAYPLSSTPFLVTENANQLRAGIAAHAAHNRLTSACVVWINQLYFSTWAGTWELAVLSNLKRTGNLGHWNSLERACRCVCASKLFIYIYILYRKREGIKGFGINWHERENCNWGQSLFFSFFFEFLNKEGNKWYRWFRRLMWWFLWRDCWWDDWIFASKCLYYIWETVGNSGNNVRIKS